MAGAASAAGAAPKAGGGAPAQPLTGAKLVRAGLVLAMANFVVVLDTASAAVR